MKANLATSLIAYARGGVRKQLLVLCLLTLCAGNMWGGTRRIYFDYSDVPMWDDAGARMRVHCWRGNVSDADYDMSAVEGQTALVYADIDEGHTSLCFYRQDPNSDIWWNKTQDWGEIGAYNRFKIKNGQGSYGDDYEKYLWADSDAAIRWTPNVAIDGLLDPLNPHNQAFDNNGEYTVTLEARTTYEFKILNGSALYGLENHVWTSSVSKYTLYENQYQIRLCTAGEGEYKFTWDNTNKQLSVTYPSVSHPSIDYCYVIDYKWDPRAILHVWNCTSELVGVWNDKQPIAGTDYPGPPLYNTTNIGGQDYFYIALGDYQDFIVAKNSDGTSDKTGDVKTTDGYGKLRSWASEGGWQWRAFTVRIQLENNGADAGHKGTEYQDVAFNSDVLSDITCPEKTHYDFQGYYTEVGDTGTQVIDKHGHWIASVEGYTDAEKRWIHEGTSTTLYAKWTERAYTIALVVDPKGAGTIDQGATIEAYYAKASADITATASTGYSFREWDFSKTGEDYDAWCADGYSSTDATIHINAQHDGRLTANFTANNYTVGLDNREADPEHGGTASVNVTYDDTIGLTSAITPPQKEHYTFGGYFTEVGGAGTQLINADGSWIKDVTGYTSHDGDNPKWVLADDLTLYAKWTETMYPVAIAISHAEAGNVQVSGETVTEVTAGYATHSPEMTAVPANAAWVFKEWQISSNDVHLDLETYKTTGTTMKINATANGQTLTAVFEPRYTLVGSLTEDGDPAGGMPGWTDPNADAKAFAVVSTTPSLQMTKTCTLNPNSLYKFEVHDRKANKNYGYGDGTYVLNAESSLSFNVSNADVRINTTAYGTYTFTITEITETDGKYYPTVTVARPANPRRVYFGWGHAEIDATGTVNSGNTGGSLAIRTTESDDSHFDITESGQWVANGCNVTYTATAQTGYTLTWYSENTYTTAFDPQPAASWTHSSISGDDNVYAKFTEVSTAVTLNNDGHGKVQINSTDQTSTTCGVTTTRQLNAVPNSGYSFSSWSITGSDISLSATNTNPTILTGGGSGASSQSVTANFSANNYTITLDDKHGGTTSASVTYDATSLTSITHATFSGWTLLGYWNTDGNKVLEANGGIVADVVNYTGSSGEWNYANNVMLYAHWSRSITLDNKEGSSNGSVTVNYDESTTASLSAPSRTGYHVEGYYADNDRTHKVMEANGTLVNYTGYVESGKWVHATATTLYTKWAPNEYTVTLDPREVESGDEGTPSVTVYYETSTNMTSAITKPTKAHYTFSGYYTGYDNVNKVVTGSKLIDGNGNWIKDVTGFTGHDGDNPTWVNVSDYTLYADWTETMYPVAIAISPAEAGNVQVSGETVTEVTAGYATHSPEMTAVPANAAWVFKEWQVTSNAHLDLEHYSTTGTTMKITATDDDQTLTAVFEPRYYLVGGEIMSGEDGVGTGTSSGMPGWDNYNKPFEIVTNSPILATCSLTLGTNKNFYIMVRDKADGFSYGKSGGVSLGDGTSLKFENKDNRVFFYSNGGTAYTFKITDVDGSGRPTVSVERPYQVNIGRKRVDIDGNDHDDNTGGTVDLSKQTAPETWTPISNGDWVPYGISVKYNASKEDGYTLDWYTASDYATQFSTEPYWFHTATSTGNGYAKFTENATSVTLSNDGHGKVQIGGVDKTSTTCGVTTTRELTAVPNEGYKFSSWSKSGDDIELSSTSTNPTTLRGVGGGVSSGQEVRANFIERWIVQPEVGEWKYAYFTIEHIEEVGGKTIGYVDITLEANTNYQFSVVDRDGDVKYKNGSDQVYFMTNGNSHNWEFATDKSNYCGITTAGAGVYRFTWNITDKKMTVTYPNFIIYRTGDKAGDERATENDVESYAGGTIAKAIEFRMRVNRLDKWYTLCLPFTVTAVKVWDDGDGAYYDIVPYWRTEGKYYTGHYILRKPVTTTNFAIEGFEGRDRWIDPESRDVRPSANTPYIIQWHDDYFSGKYISFFGDAGQTIPTAMNQGANTSSDETVNIYGNNSMTTGTVCDAYMLDSDYGSGGAWLRAEVGTDRTVLPFECFIRANATTTAKYRVLRRDMADDTPTGLDTLSKTEDTVSKVLINNRIYIIRGGKMYTIQGTFVKEVE